MAWQGFIMLIRCQKEISTSSRKTGLCEHRSTACGTPGRNNFHGTSNVYLMPSIWLLPDEPRYSHFRFLFASSEYLASSAPRPAICNLEITDSFSTHEASTSQRAQALQPALRQSAGSAKILTRHIRRLCAHLHGTVN